jgi:membrane protein required for colicin V production
VNGLLWPDILIAAIFIIAALKGYKRGFIMELSGAVALALALIVPWFYNGAFDAPIGAALHAGSGPAHVVAIFLVGIATYAAVMLAARILSSVAKLPVIGAGNALGGAAVGLLKAAIGVWIVLYVALFFPLSPEIRADLHRSTLVSYVTQPNKRIDGAIVGTLPAFVRPMVSSLFARHRV